jgi:hypothetical protein
MLPHDDLRLSTHGVDTIMDYGRGLMEELKKIRNTEEVSAITECGSKAAASS